MYLPRDPELSGFMDVLNDIGDDISGAWDSVSNVVTGAASWVGDKAKQGVSAFRAKNNALTQQIIYLDNHYPATSAPKAQWDEYLALMAQLRSASDKATTVDDQIKTLEKSLGVTLGSLGAVQVLEIPAVLVAAIVAATYAISKAMDLATRWRERSQYIDAAVSQGKSATAAADAYDGTHADTSGGLFGDASKLLWPVAIIGGLYLISKMDKR